MTIVSETKFVVLRDDGMYLRRDDGFVTPWNMHTKHIASAHKFNTLKYARNNCRVDERPIMVEVIYKIHD